MRHLLLLTLYTTIVIPSPTTGQSYIPPAYIDEARNYYNSLDSAQWADVWWHIEEYDTNNAIIAGLEGSNRSIGKHLMEHSHQDVGFSDGALALFFLGAPHDSLNSHRWAAMAADSLFRYNYSLEVRRESARPLLNAAMRYPGGSSWRNRLLYGLHFMARRLILKDLEGGEWRK